MFFFSQQNVVSIRLHSRKSMFCSTVAHPWVLLLGSLLLLLRPVAALNCTVTGGSSFSIQDNSVLCDGSDACLGATISGCDRVVCNARDCTSATIRDSGEVICKGESACRQATIGTLERPVTSVTCQGASWTCYQATIFSNETVVCEDNSGMDISSNGVCGFATLETPCLQCLGTNSGCDENCKLSGENCPVFRYGGETCDAICPAGQSCPVNVPDGQTSSGRAQALLLAVAFVPLVVSRFACI